MSRVEIHISAFIPAGNDELGHEAIVAVKAPVAAVVDVLNALKLPDVVRKIRLINNKGPKAKADPVPAVNIGHASAA